MLLLFIACWQPAPVELPASNVRSSEEIAAEAVLTPDGDPALDGITPVTEPELNPDPEGMDPYLVVTVNAPVTLVDDAGKPVVVLNTRGSTMEVRQEDGAVRRKVWCSFCAPPVEAWVRTEDVALARLD